MILRGNETYAAEIPDGGGISSRFFRKCSGLESAVWMSKSRHIWVISLVGRREEGRGGGVGGGEGGRGGRGRIAKGGGRGGRDEKDEKEVEEEK